MRTDFVESETAAEAPYDWRRDGWLAACAAAVALLVISAATPPAPGYDKFLRIFVFCLALVRAFAAFRRGGAWLPLSACVIAILFNPAAPIRMSHTAWVWCDLIAAAWFAIAGAWQLLRRWQPQRGWAAAAVSLAAVAVPAVAAMNMPNRDALTPAELNENLADLNVAATSPPPTTAPSRSAANAASDTSAAPPQPAHATEAAAPLGTDTTPHTVVEAQANETANRASPAGATHPAPVKVVEAPPFPGNDAASTDSETPATAPVSNDSVGNQEME